LSPESLSPPSLLRRIKEKIHIRVAQVTVSAPSAAPVASTAPAAAAAPAVSARSPYRRPGFEELLKEREARELRGCTFQPNSHADLAMAVEETLTTLDPAARGQAEGQQSSSRSGRRIDTLAQSKATSWQARESARRTLEEKQLHETCTFQPKVVARSRSASKSRRTAATTPAATVSAPGGPLASAPPKAEPDAWAQSMFSQTRAGAVAGTAQAYQGYQEPLQWESSLARQYIEGSVARKQMRHAAAQAEPVWAPAEQEAKKPTTRQAGVMSPKGKATAAAATQRKTSPRVAATPASLRTTTKVAAPPPLPPSAASDVVSRLYAEADQRTLRRAKAKADLERTAAQECTFRPNINPNKSSSFLNDSRADGASLNSSMQKRGGADGDTTYAGTEVYVAGVVPNRPLHERAEELQRKKAEAIARLRIESAIADPDLTFQPKINPVSAKLAVQSRRYRDVDEGAPSHARILPEDSVAYSEAAWTEGSGDATAAAKSRSGNPGMNAAVRLAKEADEAHLRKQQRAEAAARMEAEQCTFAPRISAVTDRILAKKLKRDGLALDVDQDSKPAVPFLERQELMQELSSREAARKRRQAEQESGCTFRPDIGNAEEVLAMTRPALVGETRESRLQRLAMEDKARIEGARAKAQEEYYAQFSFKPAIAAGSKSRGRAHTIEEHYRNEEGKRIKLKAAAMAEAEFREKHPFKPKIAEGSRARTSDSKDPGEEGFRLAPASDPEGLANRIGALQHAKDAKLEAARRLRDAEELRECTFHPVLKQDAVQATEDAGTDKNVVVVRGLGRFLELKELSRRMEEDKKYVCRFDSRMIFRLCHVCADFILSFCSSRHFYVFAGSVKRMHSRSRL
jgi:hypothetical protein